MIVSMNHVSFTVSDLGRSIEFFSKALGLEPVSRAGRDPEFAALVTGIPGASIEVAYLKGPGCAMELIRYLAPAGEKIDTRTCNVGSAHVCFDVTDMQGSIDRFIGAGGRLAGGPAPIPAGPNKGRLVAYLEDPDDNTVEFIEAASPA